MGKQAAPTTAPSKSSKYQQPQGPSGLHISLSATVLLLCPTTNPFPRQYQSPLQGVIREKPKHIRSLTSLREEQSICHGRVAPS